MDILLVLLILLLAGANIGLFVMLRNAEKRHQEAQNGGSERDSLVLIQNQISELSNLLGEKLDGSRREMTESVKNQFAESQKLIKSITQEITEVKETNKQVFSITSELQELQKVLKNQKQRGNLGEAGLKLILENVLPPSSFTLQYQFNDGETVDAAIETKDGIIPVDAKFSLDNYIRIVNEDDETQRQVLEKEFKNDLKLRIDETAKYIRPQEGTLPFALMYIPAEGIYYDLLVNQVGSLKVNTRNLIDYAFQDKNVIIVSPTTFMAYLHTILQGFRAFRIEESAKQIEQRVEDLRRHLEAYEEHHDKLGNSLGTVVNHFNKTDKEFRKIDKDIIRINGEGLDRDILDVPKPDNEDN